MLLWRAAGVAVKCSKYDRQITLNRTGCGKGAGKTPEVLPVTGPRSRSNTARFRSALAEAARTSEPANEKESAAALQKEDEEEAESTAETQSRFDAGYSQTMVSPTLMLLG